MSATRHAGWWLPNPNVGYSRPDSETRFRRMKFFAAWSIRVLLVVDACFAGLMFTEADLSFVGAAFAGGLFAGVTGIALVAVLAAIWTSDL